MVYFNIYAIIYENGRRLINVNNPYTLSFEHLTNAITKGLHFSQNDIVDILDDVFENEKQLLSFADAHRSLAYLITSEYIHEQLLPDAIEKSLIYNVEHPTSKEDRNYVSQFIETDYLIRQVLEISDEEKQACEDKKIKDRELLITDSSYIFPIEGISISELKKHLSTILSVIEKYIENNFQSDDSDSYYAAILKTYLPEIIFSFITNYSSSLCVLIDNITKITNNKRNIKSVIKKLCHPYISISVCGNKVRELSKTVGVGIKTFKYTKLHNAVLYSSKNVNFPLSFIWYERNVGTYQFYLKRDEYADVISSISKFEAKGNFKRMNIKKSVILYNILKDQCDFNCNELVRYTSDCLFSAENNSDYECFYKETRSEIQLLGAIQEITETISECYKKSDLEEEMTQVLNDISEDELSQRIATTLINYIFYNDIWNRKNFVVPKPQYLFNCESIKSTLFEMSNVTLSLWIVDMNADCPEGLKKISYSSSLDMLYPSKDLCYGESVYIDSVKIPECLISITTSHKTQNKSSSISFDKEKSPCKTGIFPLKQAEFSGITIERDKSSSDELDPLYRHSVWTQLYNQINNTGKKDKICFGLNYYLTNTEFAKEICNKNISGNIINSIEDTSDLSNVFNRTSAQDYEDKMVGGFQPYKETCSSNIFNSNSNRLVASCSKVYRQSDHNEPLIRERMYKKYSDAKKYVFDNDKAIQLINFSYTNDITIGLSDIHLMDIYYPLGASKEKYPVIVTVNGECWCFNDKNVYGSYEKHLATKGFAVVNFNYRIGSRYKYPDGLIDVCCLMDHLKSNANKYKLDMSHLYMIGNCTGAHLVFQYSVLASNPKFKELFNSVQNLQLMIPYKIALNNGIYKFNGYTPYLDLYLPEIMAPLFETGFKKVLDYINKGFPQAYIAVNVNDQLCLTAESLAEKFSEFKIKHEIKKFGLMDASIQNDFIFDAKSKIGKECTNLEIDFFRENR